MNKRHTHTRAAGGGIISRGPVPFLPVKYARGVEAGLGLKIYARLRLPSRVTLSFFGCVVLGPVRFSARIAGEERFFGQVVESVRR